MLAQLPIPERGPDRAKTYTIATTSYAARELGETLGRIDARRPGPMLRDLTVGYLKRHGFAQFGG
jgi:hypothetical protein